MCCVGSQRVRHPWATEQHSISVVADVGAAAVASADASAVAAGRPGVLEVLVSAETAVGVVDVFAVFGEVWVLLDQQAGGGSICRC